MPFFKPSLLSPTMSMNCWYRLSLGLFAFLFRDAAGKITSGHWHPSAPAPQCPSPAVFLYYKPGLPCTPRLPISCTSCNRKSLGCARGSHVQRSRVLGGRGSFEPGLKSGSSQSPVSDALPSPPPISGGSALCHSAP